MPDTGILQDSRNFRTYQYCKKGDSLIKSVQNSLNKFQELLKNNKFSAYYKSMPDYKKVAELILSELKIFFAANELAIHSYKKIFTKNIPYKYFKKFTNKITACNFEYDNIKVLINASVFMFSSGAIITDNGIMFFNMSSDDSPKNVFLPLNRIEQVYFKPDEFDWSLEMAIKQNLNPNVFFIHINEYYLFFLFLYIETILIWEKRNFEENVQPKQN